MFCANCGNNIKDGLRFCEKCGWAVPVTASVPDVKKCASCGTVLNDEMRFCPKCGGAVPAVSAPVPPAPADNTALDLQPAVEKENSVAQTPKKKSAVDKAVFHHLGNKIYACYFYKDGVAVGNMTDTNGEFIPDVKEWLETQYENIVIETVDKE